MRIQASVSRTKAAGVRTGSGSERPCACHAGSNQAVQAKLRVGAQDDPLEREADRTADRVVAGGFAGPLGSSSTAPQHKCPACAVGEKETVRRQPEEHEEEEALQLKANTGEAPATVADSAAAAISQGGRPMSAPLRRYFEPRFGAEFSRVRIHTHEGASRAATRINARAYTFGNNVAFARNQYAPHSATGRRLLAHELTHVAQQRGAGHRSVQRTVNAATSSCPANVNDAPADPIAELETADARAQTMALGTSHLLFLESLLFTDPNFGPGEETRAYERRFGRPERRGARFRNRFTRELKTDENEVMGDEMQSLATRFERLHRILSGNIRYRCPGNNRRITVGGCRDRCTPNEFAWTCRPSRTFVVCPLFWTDADTASADQRAGNFVHEGMHIAFNTGHGHANQRQRGRNAECYEAMAADLYGFNAEIDDCPAVTP